MQYGHNTAKAVLGTVHPYCSADFKKSTGQLVHQLVQYGQAVLRPYWVLFTRISPQFRPVDGFWWFLLVFVGSIVF
jgi:hypothetical protein